MRFCAIPPISCPASTSRPAAGQCSARPLAPRPLSRRRFLLCKASGVGERGSRERLRRGSSDAAGMEIEPLVEHQQLLASAGIAGRSVESFHGDFGGALIAGKVPLEVLQKYLELEQHIVYRFVWSFQGMRERLLADPGFPAKMSIEVGIGICTKLTAEGTKRGDLFFREIDFVFANVVMAVVADWMLTWLPAPTLSYNVEHKKSTNPFVEAFAGCPDNAFQMVHPGQAPYTISQRCGAVLRNGVTLLGVGFGASLLGVGLCNSLVAVRLFLDPAWGGPPNAPQDILATSAAYGLYMAVSSNLRYQIMAGLIEERGIETYFKGNQRLCTILSFILRTGNTFLGSLLWVDFTRLLGMQKAKGPLAALEQTSSQISDSEALAPPPELASAAPTSASDVSAALLDATSNAAGVLHDMAPSSGVDDAGAAAMFSEQGVSPSVASVIGQVHVASEEAYLHMFDQIQDLVLFHPAAHLAAGPVHSLLVC